MNYNIWDTCFFFPWELNRGECASWVQAWGSVLAIIFAVLIALYQAKKQQRISLATLNEQRRQDHLRVAETLGELARNALKLQQYLTSKLNSREAIYAAAEDGLPFDMPGLHALERSLDSIQLHGLPASLVSPSMILSWSVRQFRIKVEMALQFHREMNGDAFSDFFKVLAEMNSSLKKTVEDFEGELQKIRDTKD